MAGRKSTNSNGASHNYGTIPQCLDQIENLVQHVQHQLYAAGPKQQTGFGTSNVSMAQSTAPASRGRPRKATTA